MIPEKHRECVALAQEVVEPLKHILRSFPIEQDHILTGETPGGMIFEIYKNQGGEWTIKWGLSVNIQGSISLQIDPDTGKVLDRSEFSEEGRRLRGRLEWDHTRINRGLEIEKSFIKITVHRMSVVKKWRMIPIENSRYRKFYLYY